MFKLMSNLAPKLEERKAFDRIKTAQEEAAAALHTKKPDLTYLLPSEALENELRGLYGRRTDVKRIEEEIKLKDGLRVKALKDDIRAFDKRLEDYASILYHRAAVEQIGDIASGTVYNEFSEKWLSPVRKALNKVYDQLKDINASANEDARVYQTEKNSISALYKSLDKEDIRLRNTPLTGFVNFEIAAFLYVKEEVKAREEEFQNAAKLLRRRARTKHNLRKVSAKLNGKTRMTEELYQQARGYLEAAEKGLEKMKSQRPALTQNAEGDTHAWFSRLDAGLNELCAALDQARSETVGIAGQTSSPDTSRSASTEYLSSDRERMTPGRQSPSPSEVRIILGDAGPSTPSIKI
jgi:uncharacterized protein YukE